MKTGSNNYSKNEILVSVVGHVFSFKCATQRWDVVNPLLPRAQNFRLDNGNIGFSSFFGVLVICVSKRKQQRSSPGTPLSAILNLLRCEMINRPILQLPKCIHCESELFVREKFVCVWWWNDAIGRIQDWNVAGAIAVEGAVKDRGNTISRLFEVY